MSGDNRQPAATIDGMNALATAYAEALRPHCIPGLVRNLVTHVETRFIGGRALVVTINKSEPTDTYVCSPHTAFIRYLREEIPTLPLKRASAPLNLLVSGFDRLLGAARIDDIVHLNNWLLSTNLTGGLTIDEPSRLAAAFAEEFPFAILAIRSLNAWSDGELMLSLASAGWDMIPSRQVWVVDDLERDWIRRRDTRRDRALARSTRLRGAELCAMTDADATRISQLYGLLYLKKYSRLNPDYSPDFIKLTHRIGMIRYLVFRDADGVIQSVAGCFSLGGQMTTPIVGYDTALPTCDGLYRLATHAIFDLAHREGLRLNLSSGAAGFKKNRGARPQIEYSAVYTRHLSRSRRLAIGALRQTLNRIAVPMMRRYEL